MSYCISFINKLLILSRSRFDYNINGQTKTTRSRRQRRARRISGARWLIVIQLEQKEKTNCEEKCQNKQRLKQEGGIAQRKSSEREYWKNKKETWTESKARRIKSRSKRRQKERFFARVNILSFRQKYPTPDDEDGALAFYKSLYEKNPRS